MSDYLKEGFLYKLTQKQANLFDTIIKEEATLKQWLISRDEVVRSIEIQYTLSLGSGEEAMVTASKEAFFGIIINLV